MRKLYMLMMAGLAACAVACQEKPLEPQTPETTPQEGRTMTFTASIEGPTKTTYAENAKTSWVAGDVIQINGYDFDVVLPTNVAQAPKAKFTGVVDENFKAPYKATYGKFNPVQQAKSQDFDPAVVELIAESETETLTFKNLTALLKFNVADKDVHSLSFVSGEDVYTLNAAEGETLSGMYYMAILPKDYAHFDIKFNGTDIVKTYIKGEPFTAVASHSYNMGDVKHSTYFLKGNKAATHQDKEWGEAGLEFIDCGKTQYGQQYVLLNQVFDAGAEFKIVYKEGNWYGLKLKDGATDEYWLDGYYGNFIPEAGTYNLYLKDDYSLVMQKIK